MNKNIVTNLNDNEEHVFLVPGGARGITPHFIKEISI